MDFELPQDLQDHIARLDRFINDQILPLQHKDDNNRFFDHRREPSRTQWSNQGLPTPEWEALLAEARQLADQAGFYRFPLSREFGGAQHPNLNLWMCAMRYHMASHPTYGGGVSLANDLQNEHSVVGNFPDVLMLHHYGNEQQRRNFIPARLGGEFRATFGLTEPDHGSDATHMSTTAVPVTLNDGSPGYSITGRKKWQTGMHTATHMILFARTANMVTTTTTTTNKPGNPVGITAFIVPVTTPGLTVTSYEYTLNMPTDHATVSLDNVRVLSSAILGPLNHGLAIAQTFTHENRIRQASSSCGAAMFCINRAIDHARRRVVFGKPLASNQAIQWPLVELYTQATMLRLLILQTANEMDTVTNAVSSSSSSSTTTTQPPWVAIEKQLGHKISMCNYYANRLVCEAADRAIQVHGGMGYSRHLPFEHIWRHFRRYRITEGSEEVQMRKVAGVLFGFKGVGANDVTEDKTVGKKGDGKKNGKLGEIRNSGGSSKL